MLRSMFSGVSGLRSHQTMMDVIGNNIANVNTAGFKASSAVFQDLLSQVISGASVPTETQGGTNPAQVGLGVKLAGTVISFNQGASQLTGRATDLSIQGDGFFIVTSNDQTLYTRAGAFSFDADGRLVTPDGAILQGWAADAQGNIATGVEPSALRMPLGQQIPPTATTSLTVGGNLDGNATAGPPADSTTTKIKIYDKLGSPIDVTLTFTKLAGAGEWSVTATATDANGIALGAGGPPPTVPVGGGPLAFDPATGKLEDPPASLTVDLTGTTAQFDDPVAIDLGVGTPNELSQYANKPSAVSALSQDGSALGSLQSFSIGADGVVTGVFSNGRNRPIGKVALASFSNPAGLVSVGGSVYRTSPNSGLAQVGEPGTGGRGTLAGSTLEMSNVDLAKEFTNLIVAQRGFQANSRVITASDELLQDLVNLKR